MSVKEKIFDLLEGTYGLDAGDIAERLNISEDHARRTAEQMLAEGRLWETGDGKYRCVLPPPPWLRAVKDSLDCDGWPGLSYSYVPEDRHLEIFPIGFIREGEEHTGICYMSDWLVELNGLLELFDGSPIVHFGGNGANGSSFSIEGTIDGEDAWVEISDRPPPGLPPDLLMSADGGFRELTEEEYEAYEAVYGEEDGEEGEYEEDEGDDTPPPMRGLWRPSEN
jgi:hypothetical protein